MPVEKLLIAPAERLVPKKASWWQRFKNVIGTPYQLYDGELIFCGDLPALLGADNTFMLGGLHPHLHDPTVPPDCPYPSCHGTPSSTAVTLEQLTATIDHVDAVLISVSSPHARAVIKAARHSNKPIALLDFLDHEELYGTNPISEQLYRGFKPKKDFDVYFKKDLLPALVSDTVHPLAPSPVRPASYRFPDLPATTPIFYSGRSRADRVQPDRAQTVALIKQKFPTANIIEHDDRQSFVTTAQYFEQLAAAQLALSPSGRSWDSYRHSEVGLTPRTALIAPQPYIATTGTSLKDGINAILYDVVEQKGRYHLANPDELVGKIKHYLDHPAKLAKIATQWHHDVLASHTITARSHHILSQIKAIL